MKKGSASKKIAKAKEYGYSDKTANDIGKARAKAEKSIAPVAKDTNKTRRPRTMPTKRGG